MRKKTAPPTRALAVLLPEGHLAKRPDLAEPMREYLDAAHAKNTRKAYRVAVKHFEAWCRENGEAAWPPTEETLLNYFTEGARDGASWSTLCLRRAAISVRCQLVLGLKEPPTRSARLRALIRGVRATRGPQKQRAPLTRENLPKVLEAISGFGNEGRKLRDRALFLVGLASGMRADELSRIELTDLTSYENGIAIRLRKSKTDQGGAGRIVRLPRGGGDLDPVIALEAWIAHLGDKVGPVFRGIRLGGQARREALSPSSIWAIVKEAITRAGIDATDFGAHSLRAGFVTIARARGLEWGEIMQQTGHRRIETVLKYDRPVEDDPAAFGRLGRVLGKEK